MINNVHLSFKAVEQNEKSLSKVEWDASKSSKPWDRTVYTRGLLVQALHIRGTI